MNKFVKGFTPDEAALIAVGLLGYRYISEANRIMVANFVDPTEDEAEEMAMLDANGDMPLEYYQFVPPANLNRKNIKKATDIAEALLIETRRVHEDKYYTNAYPVDSVIRIYSLEYDAAGEVSYNRTILVKESLALWFCEHDEVEAAKLFDRHIEQAKATSVHAAPSGCVITAGNSCECASEKVPPIKDSPSKKKIGAIKEQTYLKIIGALTTALSNTSTDSLQKKSGEVLVGYSKSTGDSGVVGYLKRDGYSALGSSTLEENIKLGIASLKE